MAGKYENIIKFIESSAKNDINVQEAFVQLAEEILNRREKGIWVEKTPDGITI